jgi:hypothetical protein
MMGPKNTTNKDTLWSERRSVLKKDLTEPMLLAMPDKTHVPEKCNPWNAK